MNTKYRRWLREQLAALEAISSHPDPGYEQYDGIADVIADARRRAADAGLPDVVKVCRVRRGGLTVTIAQEVLAACLAAVPSAPPAKRDRLSPPEVAKRYGVSPDTVRAWIENGQLKATNIGQGKKKPRFRIEPQSLEEFDRKRTAESRPPTPSKRRPSSTGLTVTKFSDRRGTTGGQSSRP